MKLIVGLGNPGFIYANSRHNIGLRVVKALVGRRRFAFRSERGTQAVTAKVKFGAQDIILAVPLTFMNLSGNAVRELLKKYKISVQDLLVVCDDMDLDFGRLKIKSSGSSGGHRGLDSIIACLGSDEFPRLRVGIGRPQKGIEPADFVLSGFTRDQKRDLAGIIEKASECARAWAIDSIAKTMNIFNRKDEEEKS